MAVEVDRVESPEAPSPNSTTLLMNVWWVRETSAFIQSTWRSIGGLICMCAVAWATVTDPSEAKMWVAATCAGAGLAVGAVQKVAEIRKA
jgi:hypothetical protein